MRFFVLVSLVLTAGCAWVKPSESASGVAQASLAEVAQCAKKGVTRSKTLGSILFIPRQQAKIDRELVVLAKNEAVVMGGDTVVAGRSLGRAEREYSVYLCR